MGFHDYPFDPVMREAFGSTQVMDIPLSELEHKYSLPIETRAILKDICDKGAGAFAVKWLYKSKYTGNMTTSPLFSYFHVKNFDFLRNKRYDWGKYYFTALIPEKVRDDLRKIKQTIIDSEKADREREKVEKEQKIADFLRSKFEVPTPSEPSAPESTGDLVDLPSEEGAPVLEQEKIPT